MERPKIEDTLVDMDLQQVHAEYQKSPNLFMHIKILDKYIDYLEDSINKESSRKRCECKPEYPSSYISDGFMLCKDCHGVIAKMPSDHPKINID